MSLELILQPGPGAARDASIASLTGADVNLGDESMLVAGTAQIGKESRYFRALLQFDLSAIPAGSTIVDATLTLVREVGDEYVGEPVLHAYRLTRSDWTPFGVTWNQYDGLHAWTMPGGDFTTVDGDTATIVSPTQNVVFDSLAALAADAVAQRGGALSLLVVGVETVGMNFIAFRSSEVPAAADFPKLVVHYEPAPPSLAVADHGDDSGATATIGGADPGSENRLLVQAFDGDLGVGAWVEAGTRAGNGTLALELSAGHYFGQVSSSVSGHVVVSPVVYFTVTDGAASIHSRCLSAVQARIRLLGLAGLANEHVTIAKLPARRAGGDAALPAVIISPQRAAMPAAEGTNSLDDVHYDVLVVMLDRDNQEPTLAANLERHFRWREQIARAFRNQRLAGVPEVINSAVEPADGLVEEAWKRELAVSAVVLRFTSRETRGFN